MGCAQSKKQVYKTEFPTPPRPAEEVELEEAREAIRQRAAAAAAEAERAAAQEKRMKARAEEAAKRAAERAEEAQRALQTLEKLKDPDFDPLNVDDYDDTTTDSTELKPREEKTPTVRDKLKMFENLALENAAAEAEEEPQREWGDVPPPPRKLTLPKAFAGLEQTRPVVSERRPPPGHIIFPDDPRIYKAKPSVTSPVTPPPSNGRDDAIVDQNSGAVRFKLNVDSPHSTSPTTEPDMSPLPPSTTLLSPPPAPSDLIHKPLAPVLPEMTSPATTSTTKVSDASTTVAPNVRVLRSQPSFAPLKTTGMAPPPKLTAPLREAKAATPNIVTYSRSVDGKLAAYERRDAEARAAPTVTDVHVLPGTQVTGHLNKYESLDAAARAEPMTEDVTLSPGKQVSGHLNKYELLDAAARAPPPPPIDLNEIKGETVAERLKWSQQLEEGIDKFEDDYEYHSLKSIERRQALIFQRAGLAPVRELSTKEKVQSINPTVDVSRHLAAYELRDAVAAAGPPPKADLDDQSSYSSNARLSGMLAMYEAKDQAARAEKEIESVERRSVVAAITRRRLVE